MDVLGVIGVSGLGVVIITATGGLRCGLVEVVHPVGDLLEGTLHIGHQCLHRLQLLWHRVHARVLGHGVAVITSERSERPLGSAGVQRGITIIIVTRREHHNQYDDRWGR